MPIEKIPGAPYTRFVPLAFGFGAAVPRAIGLGDLALPIAFGALPESVQIDDVSHVDSITSKTGDRGWERTGAFAGCVDERQNPWSCA
jgi:hypothetical protein